MANKSKLDKNRENYEEKQLVKMVQKILIKLPQT